MCKYNIGDFVKFVDRPSDQILEGTIVNKYYESGIQMMAYDIKVKDGLVYYTVFETNIDAYTTDQTAKSDAGGQSSQMKIGDYVKFNDKYEKTQIGKISKINYDNKTFEVLYDVDKESRTYTLDFDGDYIVYSERNKEKDPSQTAKADEGKAYPIRFEVKAVDDTHCLYDFVYSDSHGCTITKQIALNDIINELFARMGAAPSQTAKADEGKLQLTLVPRQIIKDIAEVRMYGNKKYHDPDNWKTVEKSRYRDAAFRHFLAYLDDPQGLDEESGIAHLKHLACNIAFLWEMEEKASKSSNHIEELYNDAKEALRSYAGYGDKG